MSKFIMLTGISGSGKSTIASELANDHTIILSSDNIRAELWGDASDQQNPQKVFDEMHNRTIQGLAQDKDIVYDATNLSSKRRAALLQELTARFRGLRTELHIVLASPEQCIENQQKRDRKVPNGVIYKQATTFTLPCLTEKWTEPIIVHNTFYRENYLNELIAATKGVSQLGPWHQETVDKHHDMVRSYAVSHGFSQAVCDVAALHDIGKPATRSVDEKNQTHFYAHAQLGAYLYLCATARTGMLSKDDWYRASLIEHHMDLQQHVDKDKLIARVGADMYKDLQQLNEADEHGAVRESELSTMSLLKFMNAFDDWEDRMTKPPYCVTVKHDGDYVLCMYQQLNSDMNIRVVQESRGSIFKKNDDGEWQYVCRPFDKFFNYGQEEAQEIDWSTARVLAKVDGSLQKLWYDNGEWHLSTNGTIDAFKAHVSDRGFSFGDIFNRALGMDFKTLATQLDPNYTYMFELTSPDTQIVIPYQDGVWYLSRRHTQTGVEEFDRHDLPGVKLPQQYMMNKFDDVLEAASKMSKDEEGFVVNDAQGHRVKVKSPEYLIAAHLANNKMVSNRNIVIYMQEGKLDDFIAYCPQYTARVQDIVDRFNNQCALLDNAWEQHKDFASLPKKEFAARVAHDPASGYLFCKVHNPDLTAEAYLLRQTTPTLMRILDLKADKRGYDDKEMETIEEEDAR